MLLLPEAAIDDGVFDIVALRPKGFIGWVQICTKIFWENGVLRRSTRRTGRFEYRAVLPGEVNAEGVNATLTDGVLTVNVPKAEAAKPRHIEITSGK